jgi:putative ABC transport system ATP-binding protein
LSVIENVELPLVYRKDLSSKDRRERAEAMLNAVGMNHRKNHFPAQLSGGQQQRVAVARAFVNNPALILADEPTGNLDSESAETVMQLLKDQHKKGATVCIVTHDPRYTRDATRTVHLLDGQVRDVATREFHQSSTNQVAMAD